jgi:dTDP-4-amino-4,6-dideoxygalactose transaminase
MASAKNYTIVRQKETKYHFVTHIEGKTLQEPPESQSDMNTEKVYQTLFHLKLITAIKLDHMNFITALIKKHKLSRRYAWISPWQQQICQF